MLVITFFERAQKSADSAAAAARVAAKDGPAHPLLTFSVIKHFRLTRQPRNLRLSKYASSFLIILRTTFVHKVY